MKPYYPHRKDFMPSWQDDKTWSDQFIPEIKGVLGHGFIATAPVIEDQQYNTDLYFCMNGQRIAARVRNATDYDRHDRQGNCWGNCITIRSARPSGAQTELTKFLHGYGDYFFYAWGDGSVGALTAYTLLDLKGLRAWITLTALGTFLPHERPWTEERNTDGTTFWSIPLRHIPRETIIARQVPIVSYIPGWPAAEPVRQAPSSQMGLFGRSIR